MYFNICRGTLGSLVDMLQFGIFVAALIAFVVIGCLATRAPKKSPKAGPAKE